MTKKEFIKLGKSARNALDGNLLIGAFAAEMVGESYPFGKSMWDVLFARLTDEELGKKFVKWMEEHEER